MYTYLISLGYDGSPIFLRQSESYSCSFWAGRSWLPMNLQTQVPLFSFDTFEEFAETVKEKYGITIPDETL